MTNYQEQENRSKVVVLITFDYYSSTCILLLQLLFILLHHYLNPHHHPLIPPAFPLPPLSQLNKHFLCVAFPICARIEFMGIIWALLLLISASVSAVAADPNDELCLSHLSQSLQDPFNNLQNWTKDTFANPCQGFTSFLQGATCNNGRIYKLSLSNLSLKGSISPFLSNCTNLQALDLSSNQLSGPIPADLQYLVNLAVLNLSANHLSGDIPQQLALCAYLNVIDLHDNQLSGLIPQQLGLLVRLSVFDVSNNKLSGPIPPSLGNRSGNLPRFNASSYAGNKGLYGYPLPPMKSSGLSVLAIVGIGLGSGLLSLVLSFTAVCIWLRTTEKKSDNDEGKISQLMPDY